MTRKKVPLLLIVALLCAAFFCGCGRSLVITTGFGRGEVFRLGKTGCRIAEVRVYLLDLQKKSEALYGEAIWESSESESLRQALKDQALSQITRVKALNAIAVSSNIILTSEESRLAEEAEHVYYAGLSDAEKKYLGLSEKNLQRMFRELALAGKVWYNLGEQAEQVYEEFYEGTPCDLNTKYWQKVTLKRQEGNLDSPGFMDSFQAQFAGRFSPAEPGEEDAAEGATRQESS